MRSAVAVEGGWDSFVLDTGEWIFRFPRRPEVERTLRSETALLPALAEALPVAVPAFTYVIEQPTLFVGYRRIAGAQLAPERQTERAGRDVGRFLGALHAFPVDAALEAGVPRGDWRARQEAAVADLESKVGPLLAPRDRAAAHDLFAAFLEDYASFDFQPALIHYDLGPTHLLVDEDGALQGVIDWADAAVGDPAVDLAWALHGSAGPFAAAVAEAYPNMSSSVRARALHYHRLGPWHEVVHGQETGDDSWIETGLAGVVARLWAQEPRSGL